MPDGTRHKIESFTRLLVNYNNRNETIPVLLVPTIPDWVILGMDFWEKSGVKALCYSAEMADGEPI